MRANNLTIRLSETQAPAGELRFDDVAAITRSLQLLATRVGRHTIGQAGVGRTRDAAAKVVGLRLSGLRDGSTLLDVSFGEEGVLPLPVGDEARIAEEFWQVLQGIQDGSRPEWVPPLVAAAVLDVIEAFGEAAGEVGIARNDGRRVSWRPDSVPREPWVSGPRPPHPEEVTISGRLEKVDLRSRAFRIRDDLGNAIALDDVVDADDVGHLVGQRTAATGTPRIDDTGRLLRIVDARLRSAPAPEEWRLPSSTDLRALLAAVPGPDPGGVEGVTHDDVDVLLALLRE